MFYQILSTALFENTQQEMSYSLTKNKHNYQQKQQSQDDQWQLFKKQTKCDCTILNMGVFILFILLVLVCYRSSQAYPTGKDMKIGIQTVFIMKQNVPFLREWLHYHINLGVDYFFLYDNSGKKVGSELQKLRTSKTSKYGFNLYQIIPYTDQQIQAQWELILQDYKDHIVYVPWKPKDDQGNILYKQPQSIVHFTEFYSSMVDFIILIDIDEFLYSQKQLDLRDYIMEKFALGYTKISMHQKKFQDRWCGSSQQRVTQIYEGVDVDTHQWAQKHIFVSKYLLPGNIVHFLRQIKGLVMTAPEYQFRFNHYNLNAKQYQWMGYQFFKQSNFKKTTDKSMQIYDQILEKGCKNRCNNKFLKLKYPEDKEKQSLCYSPHINLV